MSYQSRIFALDKFLTLLLVLLCFFCLFFVLFFAFFLVFAILGGKHYTGFSSDLFPNFIKSFFKKVAIAFVIYFVLLQLTTRQFLCDSRVLSGLTPIKTSTVLPIHVAISIYDFLRPIEFCQ